MPILSIPDLPATIPDDPAYAVADDAGGDANDDPFTDLAESDESLSLPATIYLFVRYCDRWGNEIDRESRLLPLGADGTAYLLLTHMARMS